MAKINRRKFLGNAANAVLAEPTQDYKQQYIDPSNKELPLNLQKTSTGLTAYTGTFGDKEIMHLLRRTLFGISKTDFDFFKTKSLNDAVDYILTVPSTPPPPPLNYYGNQTPDPDVPFGATWVNAPFNGNIDFIRRASFKSWWMSLIINNDRTIREKMTLFWHNHFATETKVINDARYVYKQNELLRSNCLGNFKALVKAVTIDPGMLVYLNGNQNTKTAPDENYARELQELFTIGKDLANHYTEDDVKAAAKVLTGFRDSRLNINSYFDQTRHDTGNKQFSSFYNNAIITGKSGAAGATELDDLLNIIFAHTEVAKYLCRKIYRFFVYYVIDETVETNMITPMANMLIANNFEIKPVLLALFKSEHFFDSLNQACVIKTPIEHIAGMARQFNLNFPPTTNYETSYNHYLYAQQFGAILSQDIGDPPNVAGWGAYWQKPQYHELWINSDSLPKRNQLGDLLLYVGYNRNGFKLMIDCLAFADSFSSVANPNTFIDDIIKLFYAADISSTTKTLMKTAFLLSGQTQDYHWTDAWNAYKAAPTDNMAKNTVNTRLQGLFKYIIGQAEYQLI